MIDLTFHRRLGLKIIWDVLFLFFLFFVIPGEYQQRKEKKRKKRKIASSWKTGKKKRGKEKGKRWLPANKLLPPAWSLQLFDWRKIRFHTYTHTYTFPCFYTSFFYIYLAELYKKYRFRNDILWEKEGNSCRLFVSFGSWLLEWTGFMLCAPAIMEICFCSIVCLELKRGEIYSVLLGSESWKYWNRELQVLRCNHTGNELVMRAWECNMIVGTSINHELKKNKTTHSST